MNDTEVIDVESRAATNTAIVAAPEVAAGPLAMAMQAMKSGMSVADMRDLLNLQKEFEANEARKAYVADMAEFKRNPPEIIKNKKVRFGQDNNGNGGTEYMHATIGDVTSLTVEALAAHGFSHRWDTEQREGGQIFVSCILTHKLGHSERTTLNSGRDESGKKNNIQALASTVTYLQRYTLLAACGLATKDMHDDDGQGGGIGEDAAADRLQEWTDKANAAINVIALNETRKMAGQDFNAAKDLPGWNAFKLVVDAKRLQLTNGGAK